MLVALVLTAGQHILPNAITEEHSEKLSAVKSVYSVQLFLVKYRYISFFNYRILEKIVECLGQANDTLKQKLQDYLTDFRAFCKHSVFEVPAVVIAKSAPACGPKKHLVIKINEKVWFGVSAIKKPSQYLDICTNPTVGIPPANFLIRDIKKGCVEILFVLLSNGIQSLFPLTSLQKEELSNFGVTVIVQPEGEGAY